MPAERPRAPGSGAVTVRLRLAATRAAAAIGIVGALLAAPAAAMASPATAASPAATAAIADPYDGITLTVAYSLFLADRSTLRVIVTNNHTYQIRVAVTAWANSGRLDVDGTPVTVVVAPQTQGAAEFPATAVSNGTVTVAAAIVDRTGGYATGTITTATFNVQAGWETPVVLIAAGLVVILAVVGIIRTVRRVRRSRREGSDGDTPETTADEPADGRG